MILVRNYIAFSLICISAGSSSAMEFRVGTWKGHPALYGEGEIVSGDPQKFATFATKTRSAGHGYRFLLLNSPGGLVNEALKIAAEIDRLKIHTVIPKGASCESACGAIVFIAGRAHTLEEGGRLGLHTCYRSDTAMPLPDCNENIALNAVAHGVSHGSLKAAMDFTPPDDMSMFTREWAECYGLSRYAGSNESGFDSIDPCVVHLITGRTPAAQAAWRIDVEEGGFSAFVRTVNDYTLAGQIKVLCRESDPGKLYFEALIPGPAERVRDAIYKIEIVGLKAPWTTRLFKVGSFSPKLSLVSFSIPSTQVREFLLHTSTFQLRFALEQPRVPIELTTSLQSSRKNLLFAANHCLP